MSAATPFALGILIGCVTGFLSRGAWDAAKQAARLSALKGERP